MKLTVKDIFEIAKKELSWLSKLPNPDFRLEQVEYDEKNNEWNVVVSFLVENTNKRTIPFGIPVSDFEFNRIYKKLKINKENKVTGLFIFDNDE